MKILFFDMEFANGKVPGSIYSFGYVLTDAKFRLKHPQTDILMNPECAFNDYVRKNILAYPLATVKSASTFPAYYKRLKKLLAGSSLAVGFAVGNDTAALRHACERYGLKPPAFQCLDMERLCKKLGDHKEAHGLSGYVEAWCEQTPSNQHRSDGDALATMMLFRAVCEQKKIDPRKIAKLFADCMVPSLPPEEKKKKGAETEEPSADKKEGRRNGHAAAQTEPAKKPYRRRRRRRRPGNAAGGQTAPKAQPSGETKQTNPPRTTSKNARSEKPNAAGRQSKNKTE